MVKRNIILTSAAAVLLTAAASFAGDLGPGLSACESTGRVPAYDCPAIQPPVTNGPIKGTDNAWSIFVGGDFTVVQGAEAEGKIFVHGNFSQGPNQYFVGGAGVGSRIPPENGEDFLVTGGNINIATPGGTLFARSGSGDGNYPIFDGIVRYRGSLSGPVQGTAIQDAINLNPFDVRFTELQAVSSCLAGQPASANGVVEFKGFEVNFRSTDGASGTYVFNVNRAIDNNSGGSTTVNLENFPANSTIIINMLSAGSTALRANGIRDPNNGVAGAVDTFNPELRSRIIWNIPNATSFTVSGGGAIEGTVLAPEPTTNVDFLTSGHNGRMIVGGNLVQNSSGGEFHNYPFLGDLPTCTGPPDIGLIAWKTATDENGDNLRPGDTLLYEVTVTNTGTEDALKARFDDIIPANTTIIPGSVVSSSGTVQSESPLQLNDVNIPAGGSTIIRFRVQLNSPLADGTKICNQGTLAYDSTGDEVLNASLPTDGDPVAAGQQPTCETVTSSANFDENENTKVVSLQSDEDNNGVISAQDVLRYTVTIQNTGTANAAGVSFSDPLPAQVTYVAGSVSASSGSISEAGGVISWAGNVNAGQAVTLTYDARINIGLSAGIDICNQGTITYNGIQYLTNGDTALPGRTPTCVTTGGTPKGFLVKDAIDDNGGNLEPGDIITFTLTGYNTGTIDLVGASLVDTIPGGTSYVTSSLSVPAGVTVVSEEPVLELHDIAIPAGGSTSISFKVRLNATLPAGVTEVCNQATAHIDTNGDSINDSFVLSDGDTTAPGEQLTCLPITSGPNFTNDTTKTVVMESDNDGNGLVGGGDVLRYMVTLTNSGNQDAAGATFHDPLPPSTTYVPSSINASSGTASVSGNVVSWKGDIPAGKNVIIRFNASLDATIGEEIEVCNQGELSYAGGSVLTDGDTGSPGASPTCITTGNREDSVATKSVVDVNGGTLEPGDVLTYTIVGVNNSSLPLSNVRLVDSIPANTSYVPASLSVPAGATIISETPTIEVEGIDVAAGASATVSFQVKLAALVPDGVTQICNQGSVYVDADGDGNNDTVVQTDGDTSAAGSSPTCIEVGVAPLPRSIELATGRACIDTTPFLDYEITPVDFVPDTLATLTWLDSGGQVVSQLDNQPLTGRLSWPGWELVNGEWVYTASGPSTALTLRATVSGVTDSTAVGSAPTIACSDLDLPPGSGASIPVLPGWMLSLLVLMIGLTGLAARRLGGN